MLFAIFLVLATQPSSEAVRITFDFDCARSAPPSTCASVLPTAAEAREPGTWNDRAVPLDLDGDRRKEYFAPIRCGATGNCEWVIVEEESCRVLGRVSGALITAIRHEGEGWSPLEGYIAAGAGHGVLMRYSWEDATYHEESEIELDEPAAGDYLGAVGKIRCPAE